MTNAQSPSDLFNLKESPVQGAFLIEASAGTGKTYSLIRIVLRLLMETDITIDKVLIVTFTNAAAGELKARLRSLLMEVKEKLDAAHDPEAVTFEDATLAALYQKWDKTALVKRLNAAIDGIDDATISTIHSFCQKMLVENSFSSQSGMAFELGDTNGIITEVADAFVRDVFQRATPELCREIIAINNGIVPFAEILKKRLAVPEGTQIEVLTHGFELDVDEKYKTVYSPQLVAILERFVREAPARVRALKQQRGIRDFDDLMGDMHRELSNPMFVERVSNLYEAVLIDEFQDTDPIQYAIFKTLFLGKTKKDPKRSLIFVGDPKQAIYKFRGADLNTYQKARSDINKTLRLAANFRSSPVLLEAINAFFADNKIQAGLYTFGTPAITYPDVAAGATKTPLYQIIDGQKRVLPVFDMWFRDEGDRTKVDPTREQEAILIADDIDRLLHGNVFTEEGTPLMAKDIAILVRKHKYAKLVTDALAQRHIRVLNQKQDDVFQTDEAREILIILQSMETSADLKRLKAARTTRLIGETINDIAPEALSNTADMGTLEKKALVARENIDEAHAIYQAKGIASAFAFLMKTYETQARLLPQAQGEKRLNNYQHVIELLQEQGHHLKTLSGLTRWFTKAIAKASDEDERKEKLENDENLVNIITVHHAKGLEYPVVYLLGAHSHTLSNSGNRKTEYSAHWVDAQTGENHLAISYEGQKANTIHNDAEDDFREEMRLVYVGMTRASQRLVLPYLIHKRKNVQDTQIPYWVPLIKERKTKWYFEKVEEALVNLHDKLLGLKNDKPDMWAGLQDKLNTAVEPEELFKLRRVPTNAVSVETIERVEKETNEAQAALVASPARRIQTDWYQTSYSAIVRSVADLDSPAHVDEEELEKEDRATSFDLESELKALEEAPRNTEDKTDILNFSRGPESGTFLHALFEHIDFSLVRQAFDGNQKAQEKLKSRAEILARPYEHNFADLTASMCERLLQDVLCAQTLTAAQTGSRDLRLCDIDNHLKVREMKFTMAIKEHAPGRKAVTVENLTQLLRAFPKRYHLPALPQKALKGFLTGAIDMVFAFDGKFYILDWKSNHIAETVAGFHDKAMADEMARHHYYLQFLIYAVAIRRYLASRGIALTSENFGGVIYAFIRAIRVNNKKPYGIYFERPPIALIACLDDFFEKGYSEQTIATFAQAAADEIKETQAC